MKRTLLWIAGSILALAIVLTTVYAFRQQLLAPLIASRVAAELESRYGVRVKIGRIGGDFVTSLELGDVETVGSAPDRPVTRISLRRGNARYWLPDLLGGFGRFLHGADIVLEGARIDVDLDRPGLKSEGPIQIPSPGDLPGLRVRDSRFALRGRGLRLDFTGLNGALRRPAAAEKAARLDLQATATVEHPRLKKQAGPLTARLRYDGGQLDLQELRFAGQTLLHASLDLRHRREGVYALQSGLRVLGGQADLQLRFGKKAVAGRTRIDGINLHALSSVLAIPGLPPLAGSLNGTAEIRADTDRFAETLDGAIDLRVDEGRFRQVAADTIRLQATARHGEVLIRHFTGRLGPNRLAIEAIGFPAAALANRQWSRLLAAAPGTFSLQLNDIPSLLAMAGLHPDRFPEHIPAHHLELEGLIGNRSLAVSRGLLRTRTGTVTVRTARLELPAREADWEGTAVEARLTIDLPQLTEIGAIFGVPGLNGALAGNVDVGGTLGAPRGRVSLTGKNLAFHATPLGTLKLEATADRRGVQVKTLAIEGGGDFLRGRGILHLDRPRRLEGVALDVSLAALARYQGLLPFETKVAGSLNGTLTAEGDLAAPKIAFRANLDNGSIGTLAVPSARLVLGSQGRTITVEQAEAATSRGGISLTATVERGPENRQFDVRLRSLRLTTLDGGELRLAAPATLSYSMAGILAAENLILRGNVGEVRLDGRLGLQTASALKIRLAGLTSEHWLSRLLGEKLSFSGLDAEVTLTGNVRKPAFRATGQAAAIRLREMPFPVKGGFDLNCTPQGLTIKRLELTGGNGLDLSLTGSLPLDPWREDIFLPGAISLAGRFDLPSLKLVESLLGKDFKLDGTMGGDLRLTGTWADPEGHLQLHGWKVRAIHPGLPSPPNPFDLTADMAVKGSTLRLRALRLSSPDIDLAASGQWTQGPALRDLLRGRGLQAGGNLDFQGKLGLPSIGWLAGRYEPIRRLGGSLAADLTVSGPARDPKVNGTLRLTGGELRTTWAIPSIENLDLDANLDGHRLIVTRSRGQLGSAPCTLAGSISRVDGKTMLNLALRGSNVLLFRNDWMMIRADGDLKAKGPLEQLAVSGRLDITNGYYQRNVDFFNMLRGANRPQQMEGFQLFSIRSGPLRTMTLAIDIGAKKPFRIENNLTKASLRPELTLVGTGELPILLGKIYVDESTIRLPTTRLQVQSGLVQFFQEHPNHPSIDLLAETKMGGYDISMQIEGTYSEPVVTLSSVPPLAHDDLLLLLLAGRMPLDRTNPNASQTQAGGVNIAMYVGRGLLADWFRRGSSGEDWESLLDRLQVELGQGISRTGQETLDAQMQVAQKVFKKDDALYLTAER
nr:translocation/assembly module TamB domain-containing protein [Desulfobacteraceae bacterium]